MHTLDDDGITVMLSGLLRYNKNLIIICQVTNAIIVKDFCQNHIKYYLINIFYKT